MKKNTYDPMEDYYDWEDDLRIRFYNGEEDWDDADWDEEEDDSAEDDWDDEDFAEEDYDEDDGDDYADYHTLPDWQDFDEKDVRYVERFLPDELQRLDQLERWRICMDIMREQVEADERMNEYDRDEDWEDDDWIAF